MDCDVRNKEEYTVEELIKNAVNGDFDSVEKLLVMYQSWLINMIWHITGDKNMVEDLRQDVSFKVFKNITKFNGNSEPSFKAWVRKITMNLFLDEKRRNKYVATTDDYVLESAVNENQSAEDIIDSNEMMSKIHKAMSELPDDYRSIVVLSAEEQLSYKEIAEIMNISVDTVKVKLFRARNMLKQKLEF